MKQKQNDNLRLLIIIGIFVITISASFLVNYINKNNLAADILIPKNSTIDIELIREVIKNQNAELINKISKINGSENLINDLEKQTSIFDLSVEKLPNGFIVSFSGLNNGNSLHPYFGFFEEKNGEIKKIHWSQNSSAEIVKFENNKLYLKNTGSYAWDTKNKWLDFLSGNDLILNSKNNNEEFINPSEIGVIKMSFNEGDELIIQNLSHQYLIEIVK